MTRALMVVVLAALAVPAWAAGGHGHGAQPASPYAGQQQRPIKSLSADDIAELKRGGGWGLAKAAELNGVPGPAHLLELKDAIPLTGPQVSAISALYEDMRSRAIEQGERLIELEEALEAHFRNGTATDRVLRQALNAIGQARAKLRYIHLATHLETPKILSPEQTATYNRLRGYDAADPCASPPEGHDAEMWRKHQGCEQETVGSIDGPGRAVPFRRRHVEGVENHRQQGVIAAHRDKLDDTVRPEKIDGAGIGLISRPLLGEKVAAEPVDRFLVGGLEFRHPVFADGGDDRLVEPFPGGDRRVGLPFVRGVPITCRQQDREFAEPARQHAFEAQRGAEGLDPVGHFRMVQQHRKRPPHGAARSAGDAVVDLPLAVRQLGRLDRLQAPSPIVHVTRARGWPALPRAWRRCRRGSR